MKSGAAGQQHQSRVSFERKSVAAKDDLDEQSGALPSSDVLLTDRFDKNCVMVIYGFQSR
jgi:hypothetical protein